MTTISVGDVLFGHVPEAGKEKIFVVLAIQELGGDLVTCLLISSRLNSFQSSKPEIAKLKMPLMGKPYLDHDSYLDCEGPIMRSRRYFRTHHFSLLGKMSEEDLRAARRIIYDSGIFSEFELEDMCIYPEDFED